MAWHGMDNHAEPHSRLRLPDTLWRAHVQFSARGTSDGGDPVGQEWRAVGVEADSSKISIVARTDGPEWPERTDRVAITIKTPDTSLDRSDFKNPSHLLARNYPSPDRPFGLLDSKWCLR